MTNRNLRLMVFDFDGVITDSEPAHFEAFRQALKSVGVNLRWEHYCKNYLTYTDRQAVQKVLLDQAREPTQEAIDDLVEKKREKFAEFLRSNLNILPGVPELLQNLQKNQIPCGICSGSIRSEIVFFLQQANLHEFFRFIVSADDVKRSKPHPEAYLLSMKIGSEFCNHDKALEPRECIAVEDSIGGINAAKAAGMLCLAVSNSYPANQLQEADLIVEELSAVDMDLLRRMIQG